MVNLMGMDWAHGRNRDTSGFGVYRFEGGGSERGGGPDREKGLNVLKSK